MNEILKYSGWRPIRDHRPPHMGGDGRPSGTLPDVPVIPATRFFDHLSYIGDQFVGCFVLETSDGLMLLDCLFPDVEPDDQRPITEFSRMKYANMLVDGLHALDLDPHNIRKILITHGHGDHFGNGDFYRQIYGCKLYMSKIDEDLAHNQTGFRPWGRMDWSVDEYLTDGGSVTLGDTTVYTFMTPGHTPGCMSIILPVTDEGRPHIAALWGGTGIPREEIWKKAYLESAEHFTQICDKFNVDVEIATHPFVDSSNERLAICRNIFNGIANPFVIGREACQRYEAMFADMCRRMMDSDK